MSPAQQAHGHDHVAADGWADRATDALAGAGYRRGGARAALIALLDEQRCALSASEIEQSLRDRDGRAVARASIYRILEELEELRMITRVEVGQGLARFEAAREEGHHHHMVCDACGQVIPFEDPELERSIQRLAKRVTFTVAEHDVVLHGACSDCRD
ncbi:MAG TPA: Fur family transcriptional regulator [Baekduia sp.]|uniref:Fur family transcriptional regulator n=1 Tax=Baekduia sp. TaxID=2600305 RepID=UPI002B8203A8|nr:Fur family transcriptional regulator [Baekduia sp.]HMJ32758.1 Fur family transcriptional regulator [Baekduia sp.]